MLAQVEHGLSCAHYVLANFFIAFQALSSLRQWELAVPFTGAKSCQRYDTYLQYATLGAVSLFDLPLFNWEGPSDARKVKETALNMICEHVANLQSGTVVVIPMFGFDMFRRLAKSHPRSAPGSAVSCRAYAMMCMSLRMSIALSFLMFPCNASRHWPGQAKKTARCIHKVHARCRHSGTSRVNANERKRQRETLSVLELLLCVK
jgi:hypothetical protein